MKKLLALTFALTMLLSLPSCTDTPAAPSDTSPADVSSAAKQEEYIPYDAYSVPFQLDVLPETWEFEREGDTWGTLCPEDTVNVYRETVGEAINRFRYFKESGQLYGFEFDNREQNLAIIDKAKEEGTTDQLKIYTREERKQFADEFYQTFFPGYVLQQGKEEESEGAWRDELFAAYLEEQGVRTENYFVYAPEDTFGEFVFDLAKEDNIVIEVDLFGNIVGMECDYYPALWENEIPIVSAEEIRTRMEKEESYQRFLGYREQGVPEEDMTCEVSPDITVHRDEETEQYRLVFTAEWKVVALVGEELIRDSDKYYYPLSDYGGAKNCDALLNGLSIPVGE